MKFGKMENVFVSQNMQKLMVYADLARQTLGHQKMDQFVFVKKSMNGILKLDNVITFNVHHTHQLSLKMENILVNVIKVTHGIKENVFMNATNMKFTEMENVSVRKITFCGKDNVLPVLLILGQKTEKHVTARKIIIGIPIKTHVII